jgi:uncharacterized protein with FMN-binding domain
MRRAPIAIVSTVAGVGALLGFRTHPFTAGTRVGSGISTSSTSSSSSTSSIPTTTVPGSTTTTTNGGTGTDGAATSTTERSVGQLEVTQYGDVQVEVTEIAGKITDVEATTLTGDEPRSDQINADAAPLLRSEALVAQSASIDAVSGATYTSDAYIASLQSALDRLRA